MSDVVTLDLRELADEWQAATDLLESPEGDAPHSGSDPDELDDARELDEKCRELCRELNLEPDNEPSTLRWAADRQGITLIRADTFADYANWAATWTGRSSPAQYGRTTTRSPTTAMSG
jgi:hypothetical protein